METPVRGLVEGALAAASALDAGLVVLRRDPSAAGGATIESVSARAAQELGLAPGTALGDAIPGLDLDAVLWEADASEFTIAGFRTGESAVAGVRLVRLDAGTIVLALEREPQEQALGGFYRELCERSPNFVAVIGFDRRLIYVNPAGAELVGVAPEELVGRRVRDLLPAEDLAHSLAEEVPAVMAGGIWRGERRIRNLATGELVDVAVTSFLIRDADGRASALATVQRDISERRRTERALRRAEERLRLLLAQVPAFVWTTDRDLRVADLFGQATSAAGLTPVGTTLEERWGPHDPMGAVAVHRRALAGESVVDESTHEGRTLRSNLEPLRDARGEIIGVIGVAVDVTEARELERQVRQSQKMDAIGQLAGGIAHDYNNMLLAILGSVDLALERARDAAIRAPLERAREAADRSAELTRRLLAFGRQQTLAPRPTDVNEVVEQTAQLLERVVGGTVEIDLRLGEDVPRVHLDPTQIEQIVMNLALNARDAMPAGGTVTIATRSDGERVELVVRDRGVGMDADTAERIFEPFFTTKETGTGLGLATVYGIVTQSDGTIDVESEPGAGATFRVTFPALSA